MAGKSTDTDPDAAELGILRELIREEVTSVFDAKIAEHAPADDGKGADDKGTTDSSRSGRTPAAGFIKRLFEIEPAGK